MKNGKWFWLVEVMVSITVFVIFATGYVFFLIQENIRSEYDGYAFSSDSLIREVEEAIRNHGITSFSSGTYSMVYDDTNGYIFFSWATIGSGAYVDTTGRSVPMSTNGSFMRSFSLSTWLLPFTGSTAKGSAIPYISLKTDVWYPECQRNGNPCITKNSILY